MAVEELMNKERCSQSLVMSGKAAGRCGCPRAVPRPGGAAAGTGSGGVAVLVKGGKAFETL